MGLETKTAPVSFEELGLEIAGVLDEDFELEQLYASLTQSERDELDALLMTAPPRALLPHQHVPDPWPIHQPRWWEVMLLVGGRGVGKTVTGAFAVRQHLWKLGKKARVGIGAPTNADARDTCLEGETGLIKLFPKEFEDTYNRSLGEARHIGGGIIKAMGTEKPKRWNGPQWSMLWFDELALCNQEAWDDANMGLRLPSCYHGSGTCMVCPQPYAVCTTTPKARKWVKQLALDKTTYVPQYIDEQTGKRRLPTTFDNMYLPERRVAWLKKKYYGSRLGQQELLGMFIDDVAGAMWRREWIDEPRETDHTKWPRFQRIVIAIDPAGSRSRKTADSNSLTEDDRQNQRKNADTAIAAVALGMDQKFYVLQIKAGQWSPKEWALEAIRMFYKYRADRIIAEKNFGGDMVESNLKNINEYDREMGRHVNGRNLPVKLVTASRGKDIRAEPVATLYEQRRVVHCSFFPAAEDQMCSFVDADDNEGADMVDALVWGVTELGGLSIYNDVVITDPDSRYRSIVVNMR